MIARITDNQIIKLEQITPEKEEVLIRHFSVRDPKAYYLNIDSESSWDGWYRRYHVGRQELALPFLDELKRCCVLNAIPLDIVDQRPKLAIPDPEVVTKEFLEGVTLEDYQVRGIKVCCSREIGKFSITTGGGKTELMCGIVKLLQCPTTIVTEQLVVLEQIVKRLQLREVVTEDQIGRFCGGKLPNSDNKILVGSIQSIVTPSRLTKEDHKMIINKITDKRAMVLTHEMAKERNEELCDIIPRKLAEALYANPKAVVHVKGTYLKLLADYFIQKEWDRRKRIYKTRFQNAKRIQELVGQTEMLLVDECDLASSDQYKRLCKRYFNGRRRYGFTGTCHDAAKPVEELMVKEHLGNVIYEVPRSEVRAANRIIDIRYYMIAVGTDGDRHDTRAYDIAVKEEIVENDAFRNLVRALVCGYPNDRTLILVDTSPIEPLGFALEKLIPSSKFVYGKTTKKVRFKVVNQFENSDLKCIIGSKIFSRGLDIKGGTENLIIISGSAKWSDYSQKIGRALRVNSRGWARVFGFFFLNNRYLYKHSRENLKAVVNLGYPTKIMIDGLEVDGESFIKSRFRLTKKFQI